MWFQNINYHSELVMRNKLYILLITILGELIKLFCKVGLILPLSKITVGNNEQKVIVSLTSYGRRVSDVLPYTIISLLRQTYRPDQILLWLDSDNWNDDNIPKSLKRFMQYGLTIRYCKDLKSYKKIVPTLEVYPDALIITCDDDIYYRKNMVERLVRAYQKDPTKIYCHRAHRIEFSNNGELLPYNDWEQEVAGEGGYNIFPTSGGGTLYNSKLLHADTTNEDLFMKLSPKADDVWLYFMSFLKKTKSYVLPYKGYIYIPLDVFYQHFHKDSNLYISNCLESENDKQIKSVVKYYNIEFTDNE